MCKKKVYAILLLRGKLEDFPMAVKLAHEGSKQRLDELEKEIIDRKRAEEALRESEEKYRTLFEDSRDAIYITTREGTFVDANQSTFNLLGYSREEMRALNARQLYFNATNGGRFQMEIEKKGFVRDYEVKLRKKDGEGIDCLLNVSVRRAPNGSTLAYQGIIRDITDRKRAEEALRESEEKYRTLVERASEGIAIVQNGLLKYVNPHLAEMAGYAVDELTDTPFSDYIHPDELPCVLENYRRRMAGEEAPSTYEAAVSHKHGGKIDVEFDVGLITYQGNPAVFTIVRDLTERRQLEAQLRLAQKMEALGTLAGGIAHNFNNLLTGIMGNSSLVLLETDPTHPNCGRLKNIEKLVESGTDLTRQLLGYAREGRYEVKPISLNQVVAETAHTFAAMRKDIRVHQELAGDLPDIRADRSQVEQVLLNLCVNAADAMPGGGDLFLRTMNVTDKEMWAKPYRLSPGAYALLTVRDTGIGMDKETRERVFDPFFTTKGMGRGTGLGLASVYGIVKAHGGYINVESEKGNGTTFSLYFPASERRAKEAVRSTKHLTKGTGTILLVDDEDMVLQVSVKMLERLGYTVLEAKGGREAVDIYEAHKNEIDLVVLDMIMPGMGGRETYDRMKEINPGVRVLLSSGYSLDGRATEILNRGCDGFIQKPFKMEELLGKVTETIGRN
jgi:two-component system cell cycle sensor histidine kinase/response regulator CckA